jgi:hypothetical protein
MVALVEASKRVATCQQAVQQAKQVLEEAEAHLGDIVSQTESYILAETAEREAEDAAKQHRGNTAKVDKAARAEGKPGVPSTASPASPGATVQASSGSGPPAGAPDAGKNGSTQDGGRFQLGMKPFTISLNAS